MNPFEAGFAEGEAAAWNDRKAGYSRRQAPNGLEDMPAYVRGWWAGYTPRSLAWTLTRQPVRAIVDTEVL